MANDPEERAQKAACQSHAGRLTVLWFLPKPTQGLNNNNNNYYYYYYYYNNSQYVLLVSYGRKRSDFRIRFASSLLSHSEYSDAQL
jgi:hypothetical protein